MADAPLTQLGRYRIVGELGRGAMGVVYKAEDPLLDRTVAIKTVILSGDDADRAEYEARFFQEAKAAGRLSHPCIITIYDVGREEGLAYIAMEMLEGVDLHHRISQGRIPVPHAIDIAEQVAEGLAFAHERGVVHRDIKPANIMIVHGERVKIMDFGIARMRISDLKTQTGVVLGTPKYMSPEQVAGHPVDHRSDIFSLGIVLYEMLTGKSPFSGTNTTSLMHSIASMPLVPPSRGNREVSAMLDLVVAKALEKDPNVRYQDVHDLASDLRACLTDMADESSVAAVPAETDLPPRDPVTSVTPAAETARTLPQNQGDANKTMRLIPEPTKTLSRHDADSAKTARLTPETTNTWPLSAAEATKSTDVSTTGPAVEQNLRLSQSRRFDSAKALQRLMAPTARDRELLSRAPRPQSAMTRMWHDREQRLLLGVVLASLLIGIVIAFG